ncbi:MAG: hypothetical protein M3142_11630 [Bacteroidota bacterium]|nr:hypothetical protein [Bacteroidota bacterium]
MEAIEFKTVIGSNGLVQIPDKYRDSYKGSVKIIILKEEETSSKEKVALQFDRVKAIIKEIQD